MKRLVLLRDRKGGSIESSRTAARGKIRESSDKQRHCAQSRPAGWLPAIDIAAASGPGPISHAARRTDCDWPLFALARCYRNALVRKSFALATAPSALRKKAAAAAPEYFINAFWLNYDPPLEASL